MDKRLVVLCSIIALDAAGIGLIYPILPDLLRELTTTREISVLYGAVLALYAFMQFVCSPVLGSLSDRFGRRPVMLTSIAGTTVDYLAMALAPNLAVLIVGRAIAGMTSANLPVAMAYVADITREDDRASRIGYLQAAFGIGFFAGPVIGGLLAMAGLRLPFVAAALLNGVTFTLAWRILPESRRRPAREPSTAIAPVSRWRWLMASRSLLPLLAVQMLMGLIGNLSSTVWLLYGHDRYSWDNSTMAYSLALLGLCHAAAQAGLTGPITARLGERLSVVAGIVCDSTAMTCLGLARKGWTAFALAPVFSLGAVGLPALQSLMTQQVDETRQGELQGIIASIESFTAVVGPLVAAAAYASTKHVWIGAVWIIGATLYVFALPLLWSTMKSPARVTVVVNAELGAGGPASAR